MAIGLASLAVELARRRCPPWAVTLVGSGCRTLAYRVWPARGKQRSPLHARDGLSRQRATVAGLRPHSPRISIREVQDASSADPAPGQTCNYGGIMSTKSKLSWPKTSPTFVMTAVRGPNDKTNLSTGPLNATFEPLNLNAGPISFTIGRTS